MTSVPRLLLLIPTTSYRTSDFLEAARRLGVEVTVASEEPSTVEAWHPEGFLTLDFRDPERSAGKVAEFARTFPVEAVVLVGSLLGRGGSRYETRRRCPLEGARS